MTDNTNKQSFTKKVWLVAGIVSLIGILLLLLKITINILLMVLAATLIALFFHGFADLIRRNIKLSPKWSMAISIIGTFLLLVLLFWLIGSKIQSQANELVERLPELVDKANIELSKSSIGQKVLEEVSGQDSKKMISSAQRFFSSTFGVLGDLYIIVFLGIFLTADPEIYKRGIIALIPPPNKAEGSQVLDALSQKLKSWLKGQFFSMAVVAILTGIGLSVLQIPLVFTLAIIAGLLNFIPNFGPIAAMVPAVLVALSQDVNSALWVAGLYIFVQMLESNLITPTIQKKLVSIPAAMIIVGQLVVSTFTGYLGIILATPVVLILMVLVQELYVEKQKQQYE